MKRGAWWRAWWSFAESCECPPDAQRGMRCTAKWARCNGRANAFVKAVRARRAGLSKEGSAVRRSDGPLIIGFGGGVNSTAMLVGLAERRIRPDVVMFADTGSEKPETYEYLEVIAGYLSRVGFPPLVRVKNASPIAGYESLEDECLKTEQIPSKAFGRSGCSFKWKIAPQERYTASVPGVAELWARGGRVVKALGYDAGETRRSSLDHDDRYEYWYPLREWGWDRALCEAAILRAGLSIPAKSACFFCPSSKTREVIALGKSHPELLGRALEMERRAKAAGKLLFIRGLGRNFAWADVIASDAAQYDLFPEPPEGCLVCSDESEAA